MSNRIIVTTMQPSELLAHATEQARVASQHVLALLRAPLADGETDSLRLTKIAYHAAYLADAYEIIEALAALASKADSPQVDATPAQGCVGGNVN